MDITIKDATQGRDALDLSGHPLASRGTVDEIDRRALRRKGLYDWRQLVGAGFMFMGMVAILIAWYAIGGEDSVWRQLPYVTSGGIGGAGLIAVGVTLLISYEHASDREAIMAMRNALLGRIDELEGSLAAVAKEVADLRKLDEIDLRDQAPKAPPTPRTPRRSPRRAAAVEVSR